MKKIAAFLFAIFSVPCMAQVEVNAFSSGMAEGVTYSLPDTRFDIMVDAQCVKRIPGEFCRYAERFLRINDAITAESTEWELSGVTLKSFGVPNKEKTYTVKLGNSVASNIHLNDDGVIEAINCEAVNDEDESKKEEARNAKKSVDPRKYFTEEILQTTSTAKMAELVAKEIYAIRESKLAITRGLAENMPKDGVSMQLVLDELNLQERTLTELFTGRVDTLNHKYCIKFTPMAEGDTTRAVLFRFSRKLGILENDNLAGAPVYYDFANLNKMSLPTEETDKKKKKEKKEIKKEGICYNVPGRAYIKIYTPGEVLFEDECPVAQFGTVEVLARNLFTKNAQTKVLFDKATGAVISVDK